MTINPKTLGLINALMANNGNRSGEFTLVAPGGSAWAAQLQFIRWGLSANVLGI